MKFLKKSALSLSVILVSGLKLSNPASAQYPNQMQIYQTKCSQGDQYSCIQLEQMYRRNERWKNEQNELNKRWYQDVRDDSRRKRQQICHDFSYDFDTSHCNDID